MAKKRKLTPKSTETTTTSQSQPKKVQKKNQQQQHKIEQEEEEEAKKQLQLLQQKQLQLNQQQQQDEDDDDDDDDEEEEEYEVIEEEFEEVEDEDEEDGEDDDDQNDVDDDDEPISNLLEPFTKEQLMSILREAAEKHPDVAAKIRKVADEDTVHRKIFVHGLGWDSTTDTLRTSFEQYGAIEDCKAVTDKVTGKSKGYGFVLFKTRGGARKALKEPQKKIGNRMTACQLAAVGPVAGVGPGSGTGTGTGTGSSSGAGTQVSEYTQRKIYVSNVAADIDPNKLMGFFSKYGEIEEGPLGLDKQTGKPKGFCLFVYRSVESARKALEEPHKTFDGHVLHCQKAIDGPKPGKQPMGQSRGNQFGGKSGQVGGGQVMGQSVGCLGYNQGAAVAATPALNPAIGQALTALLATQGAGLGLNSLIGTLGAGVGAYGGQSVGVNPSVLGGYATQGGLQSAYPNQQMGQGGAGRSQFGHMGSYTGH